MYKYLIQEANEKNQFLKDEMQSLPNSYVSTKFLRIVSFQISNYWSIVVQSNNNGFISWR